MVDVKPCCCFLWVSSVSSFRVLSCQSSFVGLGIARVGTFTAQFSIYEIFSTNSPMDIVELREVYEKMVRNLNSAVMLFMGLCRILAVY